MKNLVNYLKEFGFFLTPFPTGKLYEQICALKSSSDYKVENRLEAAEVIRSDYSDPNERQQ